MQYSLLSLFALFAAAAAAVTPQQHNEFIKRQNAQNEVPVNVAAMTDAQGNVIQFDSTKVNQGAAAQGV